MGQGGSKVGIIPNEFMRMSLYAAGPFFGFPHKPIFNAMEGADYVRAYMHFRRDHKDPYDLFYHILCLFYQLGGNYGLLGTLDTYMGLKGVTSLSTLTTAAWAATLLTSPKVPAVVRLGSVLSTVVVQRYLSPAIRRNWFGLITAQGVAEALGFAILGQPFLGVLPLPQTRNVPVDMLGYMLVRYTVQYYAQKNQGCLKDHKYSINAALCALMLFWSRGTAGGQAFRFGMAGWLLAILTDEPATFFWSVGYSASLMQGVAHLTSGELPTLPQLNNIADEYAHTTFFPNLLLQSVHQSLTGVNALDSMLDSR